MSNGTFSIEDAGFNMGVNVRIRVRNAKTGRILQERKGHNRCLKSQLMGIVKWLNGEFNDTQPYMLHYDFIPRYLGLGTNRASYDSPTGITTEVSVNDTMLLNELAPRIKLPERNTVINRSSQDYVQLVIVCYLPEDKYNDQDIAEAGLFSNESGNNCLFRITFDPIHKTKDTVVEVNWTISVISVNSMNQPYEGVDKSDLYTNLRQVMTSTDTTEGNKGIPSIYANITDLCNEAFQAMYTYSRTDLTQDDVDAQIERLFEEAKILNDLEPGGEIIPEGLIDTSGGTVQPQDILLDKIAYSQGAKVIGTMRTINETPIYKNTYNDFSYETKTVDGTERTYFKVTSVPQLGTTGEKIAVTSGTYTQYLNIPIDVLATFIGLTPEKIKFGETILGVTGTYRGNS